jgi:hypothetical protein
LNFLLQIGAKAPKELMYFYFTHRNFRRSGGFIVLRKYYSRFPGWLWNGVKPSLVHA